MAGALSGQNWVGRQPTISKPTKNFLHPRELFPSNIDSRDRHNLKNERFHVYRPAVDTLQDRAEAFPPPQLDQEGCGRTVLSDLGKAEE